MRHFVTRTEENNSHSSGCWLERENVSALCDNWTVEHKKSLEKGREAVWLYDVEEHMYQKCMVVHTIIGCGQMGLQTRLSKDY